MRDFARIIKNVRENAHLTRAELAERIGVSKRTVEHWELGESKPNGESLLDIYEVCNAEVEGIIFKMQREDTYNSNENIEVVRQRLITYIRSIANEDMIRQLDYNLLSKHGSIAKAQVNLCTAYNHFQKEDKYDICRMIIGRYKLRRDLKKLINIDEPSPDIEYLERVCENVRNELIRNEGKNT